MKIIGLIKVLDPAAFDAYRAQVTSTLARYSGQIISRGNVVETYWHELGCEAFDAMVELSFPTRDDAQAWAQSPEYAALLPVRAKAMRLTLFGVD